MVSTGRAEKCKGGSSSAVVGLSWGHWGWVCAVAAGTVGSLHAPCQPLEQGSGACPHVQGSGVSSGSRTSPWGSGVRCYHGTTRLGVCVCRCARVCVCTASPGALRVVGDRGGPVRGAAGVSLCPCVPVRTRLRCRHRAARAAAPPQCVGSGRGAACIRQRCHGTGGSRPRAVAPILGGGPGAGVGSGQSPATPPCRGGMPNARSCQMTLIHCPLGHEGGRIQPRRRARGANPG